MCPNVAKRIGAAKYTITLFVLQQATSVAAQQNGRHAEDCQSIPLESYDLPLHIAAIFVVLVGSCLGITLPIFTKGQSGRIWSEAFFLARFFGTGVIISTAFVHLIYESFYQLESPCIQLAYQPTAPAIIMAAALLVMLVDFHVLRAIRPAQPAAQVAGGCCSSLPIPGTEPAAAEADAKKLCVSKSSEELELEEKARAERRKYMDLLVIEGGIVFHSVMVGLGLGVSTGTGFVPYFIAIVFHQFCDGLAIGVRIAELDFTQKRLKQLLLISAYTFVTPFGISLGVGVRTNFNANDPKTILAIGVLDSISAGVLLYGAMVDMIAKDFLFGPLLYASTRRVWVAIGALLAGAFVMSLLGNWA